MCCVNSTFTPKLTLTLSSGSELQAIVMSKLRSFKNRLYSLVKVCWCAGVLDTWRSVEDSSMWARVRSAILFLSSSWLSPIRARAQSFTSIITCKRQEGKPQQEKEVEKD